MPAGNPNYPRGSRPRYGVGNAARQRQLKPYDQGPVAPLPIVVTVGVSSGPDGTTATITGSVNPNGADTNWWITYGTVLPLPGTNTLPTDVGGGTAALTVVATIGGLTPGITYYFAVVGQSGAGTVYGQTLSLVPGVSTTPSPSPISAARALPFGQPSVTIPHFSFPFTLAVAGAESGAVVEEQDTLEEILANVKVVASCQIGQCSLLPSFGIPDPTFSQAPPDASELVDAIQNWEPRAQENTVTQMIGDETNWGITLTTSNVASQNV